VNGNKCLLPESSPQGSSDMSAVFSRIIIYFNKYPLLRGVATYAVIWPVSNLCQQAISGKDKFDLVQALRYSVFGAFYVAPSLHGWLKLSGSMWPQMNLKSALTKVTIHLFYDSFSFLLYLCLNVTALFIHLENQCIFFYCLYHFNV
jgi:hypothetical protein